MCVIGFCFSFWVPYVFCAPNHSSAGLSFCVPGSGKAACLWQEIEGYGNVGVNALSASSACLSAIGGMEGLLHAAVDAMLRFCQAGC